MTPALAIFLVVLLATVAQLARVTRLYTQAEEGPEQAARFRKALTPTGWSVVVTVIMGVALLVTSLV